MGVAFDEVVKLAEQLDPEHQNLLIYRLRLRQMQQRIVTEPEHAVLPRHFTNAGSLERGSEYVDVYRSPTRDELILDTENLRGMPVRPDDGLLGKYANLNVREMSEESFHAQMHAIATEWEQELDDLASDRT